MKPKLLIFINTLHFGGAERVVSQLLNHLNDDFELHLALYSNIINYSISNKVKVFDLKENANAGNITTLLRIPLIARRLSGYCKKNNIQTSVSFLNRPCYANAIMKKFWGYKGRTIMCERSHQSSILNYIGGRSSLYKLITKKLIAFSYQQSDLVIANSKLSKADLQENFGVSAPIKVIYNPIDIKALEEKAAEMFPDFFEHDIFYFITTGNFRVEKNFSLLIKAFSHLKQLPVKLIFVGGGALETELKNQVQQLGIAEKVIFTGFKKNPFKYMNGSDCFVLSSLTEGFPNVLLEALACGKPVISTDCKSGPRELLAPNTSIEQQATNDYEIADYGLLTPANNALALAKAMKRMYEDKFLQKSFASKAKARAAAFDVNIIKEYFIEAFSA